MPLEETGIKSLIEGKNDMRNFYNKLDELNSRRGGGSGSGAKGGGGAMTPQQWNKQWATLKTGESMVGLDGKTYTKK